ncbi:MAG: hypothetical protein QF921_05820 [Pseudomonadales bacterium]|nr:hypothetical protein [Pseudomonadales bacterium]MDP6471980.1 hypothetical protein [Pseudomonadales bacterium]MDP6826749.1 hypothetical protein [Pseudomonadales bacterium]MDP6971020.1 hypothetical protein [Pseudomonadales bacterium]
MSRRQILELGAVGTGAFAPVARTHRGPSLSAAGAPAFPLDLDATAQAAAIRTGKLSPLELMYQLEAAASWHGSWAPHSARYL